jgi:hypothetical protein
MKKAIFLLIMSLSVFVSFAQDNQPQRVYCELLGSSGMFSSKCKVTIDFGQNTSFWKGTKDQQLVDEHGKDIKFNSMVDAMNFMGKLGWKFVQAYAVTIGNNNVYHWLLYKDINNENEMFEGFKTKEQFNSNNSN